MAQELINSINLISLLEIHWRLAFLHKLKLDMTAKNPSNPLVTKVFRIPFDNIRPEHVEPAVEQLLQEAEKRLASLASSSKDRTYCNTLTALEEITHDLGYAMGIVGHLEGVATEPNLRSAYNAVQPKVSAFYSSIALNEKLWKQLKSYAASEEAKTLPETQARFLKKTISEFRRNGAELDTVGKKRLSEINVELTKLTTKYSQNVLDATNEFELFISDEQELAGLPAGAIAAARESAKRKNVEGWRFTLQQPSLIAVLTYLDDRTIRERIYRAYTTRAADGKFDNREIIGNILRLRHEKALLLGYQNFADLVLEDRMAGSGGQAKQFISSLRKKTSADFETDKQELKAFYEATEGLDAPDLAIWDIAYYAEKLRKTQYDFDEEDLRPYFSFEAVNKGLFNLAHKLYEIQIEPVSGVPTWDSSVSYYTVYDADGHALGSFYADFFPRENKRDGAWMDSFITAGPDSEFETHLGLICGNLTPPLSDRPALLTHREVETIFHEFGHLLHHLLSEVSVRSLAGTNVAWDFVELPSQIMENWCWERKSLDLFAKHWKTNEPIPDALFTKMQRARNFRSATAQMRQLSFGTVDLALHIDYSHECELMPYVFDILNSFSPVTLPPEHTMITAFTHLFSSPVGYAAGYYSYKWSEVLDADAFTRFANVDIFSREVGMDFRDKILSRGDSQDPAVLFRDFMGRDPDPTALLKRLGLTS
tara:strand:- start:12820 stop:14949 length:2130 start_codon:yes stop_codon:yes gene_type:complete